MKGKTKPLKDVTLAACLHVTAETVNRTLTLREVGSRCSFTLRIPSRGVNC